MIAMTNPIKYNKNHRRGFSIVEYIVLLVILMSTLVVFNDYISRGLAGRWKSTGDQFGYGRQFEPTDTIECAFSTQLNKWYDVTCVENKGCPPGQQGCERAAINLCEDHYCSAPQDN